MELDEDPSEVFQSAKRRSSTVRDEKAQSAGSVPRSKFQALMRVDDEDGSDGEEGTYYVICRVAALFV